MPVYEVNVAGDEKPRLVQAKSGAVARAHVATAKAISADRMAELIGQGVAIETASKAAEAAEAEKGAADE